MSATDHNDVQRSLVSFFFKKNLSTQRTVLPQKNKVKLENCICITWRLSYMSSQAICVSR